MVLIPARASGVRPKEIVPRFQGVTWDLRAEDGRLGRRCPRAPGLAATRSLELHVNDTKIVAPTSHCAARMSRNWLSRSVGSFAFTNAARGDYCGAWMSNVVPGRTAFAKCEGHRISSPSAPHETNATRLTPEIACRGARKNSVSKPHVMHVLSGSGQMLPVRVRNRSRA